MRIRSIRPEFWTSEDIAAHTWTTRLVYIGLWSYVDDNGVGRDLPRLIAASLFPLEDDAHGALTECSLSLQALADAGQITRYTVAGKPYLHVTSWEKHQKINRPTEGRYPLPTCDDAVAHVPLTEPSLSPHAVAAPGEGEKGRRGEGEKGGGARSGVVLSPAREPATEARNGHDRSPSWDLVNATACKRMTHPTKSALAVQVGTLLHAGSDPHDVHAGLEAWANRADARIGLLPHLVDDALRARTTQPGSRTVRAPEDTKAAGWLSLAPDLTPPAHAAIEG